MPNPSRPILTWLSASLKLSPPTPWTSNLRERLAPLPNSTLASLCLRSARHGLHRVSRRLTTTKPFSLWTSQQLLALAARLGDLSALSPGELEISLGEVNPKIGSTARDPNSSADTGLAKRPKASRQDRAGPSRDGHPSSTAFVPSAPLSEESLPKKRLSLWRVDPFRRRNLRLGLVSGRSLVQSAIPTLLLTDPGSRSQHEAGGRDSKLAPCKP